MVAGVPVENSERDRGDQTNVGERAVCEPYVFDSKVIELSELDEDEKQKMAQRPTWPGH